MDRKVNESIELFRAFSVEEIREVEQRASVMGSKWSTPSRGEDSSSYGGPIKTD